MFLNPIIAIVALGCPFLIFLDYHKRSNIRFAVIYVIAFFGILFLASKIIYHYGMFLALATPFLLLAMCLVRRKQKPPKIDPDDF